jgi:hypothetical protein
MKIFFIAMMSLLLCGGAVAQTDTTKTDTTQANTPKPSNWITSAKVQLNFEEGLYANWVNSGFNYLSSSLYIVGRWNYKNDDSTIQFINSAEGNIGTMYQEDAAGWRKTDDKILLASSFNRQMAGNFNWNGSFNYRGMFDPFITPTILLAVGGTYINGNLNVQLNPITERLIMSLHDPFKSEFGCYSKVTYHGKLMENVNFAGRFEWFYQYGAKLWTESFWNVELRFDGKINKWISAGLVIEELFDLNQSKQLQSREKIGIGITYDLQALVHKFTKPHDEK